MITINITRKPRPDDQPQQLPEQPEQTELPSDFNYWEDDNGIWRYWTPNRKNAATLPTIHMVNGEIRHGTGPTSPFILTVPYPVNSRAATPIAWKMLRLLSNFWQSIYRVLDWILIESWGSFWLYLALKEYGWLDFLFSQ